MQTCFGDVVDTKLPWNQLWISKFFLTRLLLSSRDSATKTVPRRYQFTDGAEVLARKVWSPEGVGFDCGAAFAGAAAFVLTMAPEVVPAFGGGVGVPACG